jgi:hypothetical protein
LLWLKLFSLPDSPVAPGLEQSWSGALVHFSAQGLQFGKDVVFTYGPLGHLTAFVYTGELFSVRVIWEFVSKTLFAAILCAAMVRLPIFWRPIFLSFILLFIWAGGVSDALYFLIISCLAALLFKHGNSSRALNILAGGLFGVFSLIKFTYFLLIILAVVLISACYCKQRRPRQALLLGLIFLFTFFLCWGLAGQQYGHLASYITTSMNISFGYKEAMGLPVDRPAILLAGITAALLGLIQCTLIVLDSRKLPALFVALFFGGATFLSWNRAFIRADDHVLSFFALCPVVLLAIWIVVRPKTVIRYAGDTISLLVLIACLWGISLQRPGALATCVGSVVWRSQNSWRIITDLGAATAQLRAQLAEAKSAHALPRVRAEVGDQTIDVFGYEQGIALLNNLNYTPRPIFQGYSVYAPALVKINTAFYSSARAPDYVLFKYQTIDDRYPALDDASVLRQVLFDYKPLFVEKGYSLWKRVQPVKPIQLPDPVTTSLAFDAECKLPAEERLWLELDIKKSLLGHILNLFYKPPEVEIRVTDNLGQRVSYRLIPSMSSTGFFINPYLKSHRQVLRLAGGVQDASLISFSVHIPNEATRLFQRKIVCRLIALPELPKTELDQQVMPIAHAVFGDENAALQDPSLSGH